MQIKQNPQATADHLRKVMNDNEFAAALLANIVHNDVSMATEQDEESLKNLDVNLDMKDIGIWIDPIGKHLRHGKTSISHDQPNILFYPLPLLVSIPFFLFLSFHFHPMLFHLIPLYHILFHSVISHCILCHSIQFYLVQSYPISFHSIPFYSI